MTTIEATPLLDEIVATVASTLKIPVERLDIDADFDSFGMDSIIAIELMTNLSKRLQISITPAQLTAVNSIRELAGAVGPTASPPVPPAPAPTPVQQATPAAAAPSPARASRQPQQRTPRTRPAADAGMERMLDAVRERYGLDLRGHRFVSQDALIDHLLAHHVDVLADYYGLDADADGPHPATEQQALAQPVAASRAGMALSDIAVIGIGCRFAEAPTPAALWDALVEGRSAIRPLDGDRWGGAQNPDALAMPRWGARIEDVDLFDAEFFGLTEDEARMCDPQERLVMQSLYHALQHAGLRVDTLRGSRTGLFLGYEYAEYEQHLRRNLHRIPSAPALSSSSPIYYLANRISFLYDFKGPSEVVNASCASSALAIHRACLSLAQGECDLAICGGVSLNLFADDFAAIGRYGLLSPDGRCAVFDDEANGFTRGEGIGLLVLKRLEDAEDGNHRIFAKIVASHQNNRGRAAFISEIKHESITQVMTECYGRHGIAPETVRYIEVDGYATKWGDSFEFEGIRNAFTSVAGGGKFCALGSIKGNIGHVEPASGVASAIKVALSLHHGRFPATITKRRVNAFIDIDSPAHPLFIADRELPFDALRNHDEPIRAGVNSFADSGVNVHLVFEEYRRPFDATVPVQPVPQLFVFSARNRETLVMHLDAHAERLRTHGNGIVLEDLAYTTHATTEAATHRVAIIATDTKSLLDGLARARKLLADGRASDSNGPVFVSAAESRDAGRIFEVIQSQIGEERLLDNLREGRLKETALLWISGIDMPWHSYWSEVIDLRRARDETRPHLIDVPPLPFAVRRHWIDVEEGHPAARTAGGADALPPPAVAGAAAGGEAAKGESTKDESTKDETGGFSASWRFTMGEELADLQEERTLDAEERLRLFMIVETARLLGRGSETIDEDANFIALGYDSVAMAGLIQSVIDLLSENIAPSVVFARPDIRSLAAHLSATYPKKVAGLRAFRGETADALQPRRTPDGGGKRSEIEKWFLDRSAAASGLIVPMQTEALGDPVFAVPGADGSVFALQTLAQSMAGVRPLFAFEAIGVDGRSDPLRSVPEIADAYIEAMGTVRIDGEIDLLGYSNGAVVAFEIARKLIEAKRRVGSLVLVDRLCPAVQDSSAVEDIAGVFADLIPALGGRHMLDFEAFAAIPEAERGDYLYQLMRDNGFGISREQFLATYRFALVNDEACRRYRPARIKSAIRTVIVRATAVKNASREDLGWSRYLTRKPVCIGIDTDHLSIVGKDASARIASLFHADSSVKAKQSHQSGA